MKIETLDRFAPALEEIAERSERATFYHTGVWLLGLADALPSLGLRCLVCGAPEAYLPYFAFDTPLGRSLWSLPFGTYGGPVAAEGSDAGKPLLESFLALRHEARVAELGLVDYNNEIAAPGLQAEDVTTHLLDLRPGFEAIWESFDKSKRRQTRKAEREGIVVSEAHSVSEVEEYYEIYERRSEQWHHSVKYPQSLFVKLFEGGRGRGVKLFLARLDDRIIGGHLNFYFKNTVIAWNGVAEKHSRAHQASTALYAACIRHACEEGFELYNLGGSAGSDSLASYKESLGGILYSYRTLRWRSVKRKIAAAVRKRLPKR